MKHYLTLADVFETIFCFVLGGIIVMIVGEDLIDSSPEGLFILMSLGMGIISFGFIRFIYKFIKSKTTKEEKV